MTERERRELRVILFTPSMGLADGAVRKPAFGIQPLGVLFVACALKEWTDFPCRVKVVDAFTLNLDRTGVEEAIRSFRPDVVGVSSTTVRVYDAREILSIAKNIDPATVTVIGGPHASSLPEDAADHADTDITVVGEGEWTFLALCRAIFHERDWRTCEGIAFREGGRVVQTEKRAFIENLDEIPLPDLDLLPPLRSYNPLPIWGRGKRFTTMVTSRGCPYGCSYCSVPRVQGGRYRFQSAGKIVAQIEEMQRRWKIEAVSFREGTFTRNRERVMELCALLEKRGRPVTWTCTARADEVDRELLRAMKRAGCTCIQIGVEQGNAALILKYKKVDREQIMEAVREIRDAGIDAHGYFMIGMPEESLATVDETITFARSLPLNTAFFNVFTPRPGTRLFEECEKEGLLLSRRWDRFDMYRKSSWRHPNLTERQLVKAKKRAYRSFYLRPAIVADRVRRLRSWRDAVNNLRGVSYFFRRR